jgi:hypothetical protein
MAFLDNTGDIILDAVLTDEGRKRLAAGDGSFRIVKFALADDEIDYALYRNNNNTAGRHTSGSAYYDLNILQTPILEAFTNNTSTMNSRLISYRRNDWLYLPVIKLNNIEDANRKTADSNSTIQAYAPNGGYVITANKSSATTELTYTNTAGMKNGYVGDGNEVLQTPLLFGQGLDSADLTVKMLSDGDPRRETQYVVELDNRLLQLAPGSGEVNPASPSFIDDDNIASYFLSINTDDGFFPTGANPSFPAFQLGQGGTADTNSVLGNPQTNTGQYGTRFGFKLLSSDSVQLSNRLFTELGTLTGKTYGDTAPGLPTPNFYAIDTVVRVTGYTTGYRVTVPIQIIRKA